MSQVSKKSGYAILIPILAGAFVAKALWVGIESYKLPKEGASLEKESGLKSLYYHYSLASKKDMPKVITKKSKPKVKKSKPKPKPQKFTKFILKGIYDSSDKKIIILKYLNKSYALEVGESIEGYKFIKLYPTYAIFEKDGKEFRLDLYKKVENKKSNNAIKVSNSTFTEKKSTPKVSSIKREGDTTYIPKNLFNKYRSDFNAIRKNIGVAPYTEGGKLKGFKIRYVKKGSDFDKLGVQKGDIIQAINGEPLNNFKVPLEFFNNLDSITAATITIKRGDEIKELEYEVR